MSTISIIGAGGMAAAIGARAAKAGHTVEVISRDATKARTLADQLAGEVIIDITNPISADAGSLVTPAGSSGAQEIAKSAPAGAHVVKAFNSLFGPVLARGGRLDAFVAADDPEARARVSTFIESLGPRPFDVGGLAMAQTLESLGLMLIGLAKHGAGTFDIALNVNIVR
jgi:predicted dinucleotide-binding enzyme